MADDIKALASGTPIHNGYAVVGELTVTAYQSRAMMSGVVSNTVLHKPVIADIKEKYDVRWTGVTYY